MPNKHRDYHIITEAMGVLLGIYFVYLYFVGQQLNSNLLLLFGIAFIIIDGGFLIQWYKPKKKRRKK